MIVNGKVKVACFEFGLEVSPPTGTGDDDPCVLLDTTLVREVWDIFVCHTTVL
jgi:hypothetical protein